MWWQMTVEQYFELLMVSALAMDLYDMENELLWEYMAQFN